MPTLFGMPGLSQLESVLASLDPSPHGLYVFASVQEVPEGVTPFAVIREDEGLTLIVPADEARAAGLPDDELFARITLGVHSALDSVGLTATVSQTLASSSISCNVVAGYHHDHLFVQADRQAEASALLEKLSHQAKGWLPEEA